MMSVVLLVEYVCSHSRDDFLLFVGLGGKRSQGQRYEGKNNQTILCVVKSNLPNCKKGDAEHEDSMSSFINNGPDCRNNVFFWMFFRLHDSKSWI